MNAISLDAPQPRTNAGFARVAVASVALAVLLAGCAPSSSRTCAQRSPILVPTRSASAEFASHRPAAPAEIAMAELGQVQDQAHQ